jgi:predicted transcriptional regulator
MEVEEQVIELIRSSEDGILQNMLWKEAGIDRRKCSRIVAKLEKEGKIRREPDSEAGPKTYRIKITKINKEEIRDFSILLVGNMFAPCTGCGIECVPERCPDLSEWVFGLLD